MADERKTEDQTLGQTIRFYRLARHWKQNELARRTGILQSYISALENDRLSRPSADTLAKLARAFGIAIEDLMAKLPPAPADAEAASVEALVSFLEQWGLQPEDAADVRSYAEYKRAQRARSVDPGNDEPRADAEGTGPDAPQTRAVAEDREPYRV